VSAQSNVTLDVLLPDRTGATYQTGNRIPIYAFLTDDRAIRDGIVEATVTGADGKETVVRLLDDGQHDDGRAGDGLYAGLYTRVNHVAGQGGASTTQEAAYRVVVHSSANHSERETVGAFSVADAADRDHDNLPDPFEDEFEVSDPNADPDGDGLDNLSEFLSGTDPNRSDSDADGENDGSEVLLHAQDPLNPADGQIAAPRYFQTVAASDAVTITYDVQSEYTQLLLYRTEVLPNLTVGPWILRLANLPLRGSYLDPAMNGVTYVYRLMAIDRENHQSAILTTTPVTPRADPIPPQARMFINGGAATSFTADVTLAFAPYESKRDPNGQRGSKTYDDIVEVLVSNSPFFEDSSWQH
ncbi:MAG: hypothetical protein KDE31_36425, partial [Caldilineaceae bacterium]|nr:hypothetical protein [Caldilineaceae bacterium]